MGRKEQGTFLTLLGGLSFAGQAAALPLLKLWVSDVFVLRLAYFCNAMHCLIYGIAVAKWQVYSNVVLVVFTELSFPAVSAITSGHVQKQRVGVALTAISGVKSLTSPTHTTVIWLLEGLTASQMASVRFSLAFCSRKCASRPLSSGFAGTGATWARSPTFRDSHFSWGGCLFLSRS